MMLGLKFHFPTHPISSIPLNRKPQTILNPFFQVKPITTFNFSRLPLKLRRINPKVSSSSEVWNGNGGGGGGVEDRRKEGGGDGDGDGDRDGDRDCEEHPRLYLRWVQDLILRPNGHYNVVAVGLVGKLGMACAEAAWQLCLAMTEIVTGVEQVVTYSLVGLLLLTVGAVAALGTLLWLWI